VQKLPETKLVAYADDSYIVIIGNDLEEVKRDLSMTMITPIRELEAIGMVVNATKTEVVILGNEDTVILVIGQDKIQSMKEMKALGVILDNKLSWMPHVEALKKRILRNMNGIRIIR